MIAPIIKSDWNHSGILDLMKILHIVPHLSKGGAEKVTVDLVNELNSLGNEVEMLLAYPVPVDLNQSRINQRVKLHFLQDSPKSKYKTYTTLISYIYKNLPSLRKFSVIHCHLTLGFYAGVIFRILNVHKRLKAPKIVFTDHSVGVFIPAWKRLQFRFSPAIFDSVILMGLSSWWERFINQNPTSRVFFIPNGIFVTPEKIQKLPKSLNGKFKVATISRLVPERHPILFLKLFLLLKKKSANSFCFEVGGDGPERGKLVEFAEGSNLSNDLNFSGLINGAEKFLSDVSIYVTLCVKNVSGIAGLEAVLSGVPVVGIQIDTDYGGSESDWIFSSRSDEVLANQIIHLIQNRAAYDAVRQAQYEYLVENLSIEKMANSYLEVYASALDTAS